jgi:ankyrin repeat protein
MKLRLAFGALVLLAASVAQAQPSTARDANLRPGHDDPHAKLVLAAAQGDATTIDAIIASGGAPHVTEPRRGATLLHVAAAQGHVHIERRLLAAGVWVHSLDRHGSTPLVYAAYEGRVVVVELLIEAGADVLGRPRQAPHALNAAVYSGDRATVHALLRAGADPDAPDFSGISARALAQRTGQAGLFEATAMAGNEVR